MPKLLLRCDFFRQISNESIEHVFVATAQSRHAQLDLDLTPDPAQGLDFKTLSENCTFTAPQETGQAFRMAGAMAFRYDEVAEDLSDGFVARPSEDRLCLRVPIDDVAALVHLNKAIERRIDDAARHTFAIDYGLLGHFAFGHVATDEEVLLRRLRPNAVPYQRYKAALLVGIASFEVPHLLATARYAHLLPSGLK